MFQSLRQLTEEINQTEMALAKEEKSYETQIIKQKEVYQDLMQNYHSTMTKFESKRTKFEFVNDHYKHSFQTSKEELDKSLKQAQATTKKMREIFSEINKALRYDVETLIQQHTLRCEY